jgi:hypothetical protein
MLETLQQFEQVAERFSPLVLLVPGAVTVLMGLFVWLGGLGLRRASVGLVGGIGGGICGFSLSGGNAAVAAVSAAVLALVAVLLQRLFVGILAAVFAVVFAFLLLGWPYLQETGGAAPADPSGASRQGPALTISESIETARLYADELGHTIKRASSRMPLATWIVIVALAVTSTVAGLFLWRFASALYCSALGTVLIFFGLILLLLWKGSMPISRINNRAAFYGLVFLGMMAFGTIEQLLLSLRTKRRLTQLELARAEEEERPAKQRWRTE